MTPHATSGIVSVLSAHSVDQTLTKFKGLLDAAAIKLFAVIDHSGEAAAAGLSMRNTKLMIFGNPKAGTPLMAAAPTIAIDLPLKALIWEDADANVWISYNSADYLLTRHRAPRELERNIAAIEQLVAKAAA